MCLDGKRQRWGKQNSIPHVPASLLKIKKKKEKAIMSWARTYFAYFHPTRAVHVQANAETLPDDFHPAKDGVIRKMSCLDLVATVCWSQQRFSTFVLISAQRQESARFLRFLWGTPLCTAPLAAAGYGWWTRKFCSRYMKDFLLFLYIRYLTQ